MEFTMIARPDAACFVGIDLHKDTLTACVLRGRDREVTYKKLACKCRDQIRSFFASLPQPSAVAIETVGFYRWLWTEIEPLTDQLVLCDARNARALAGSRLTGMTRSTWRSSWQTAGFRGLGRPRKTSKCSATGPGTATASHGSMPRCCIT